MSTLNYEPSPNNIFSLKYVNSKFSFVCFWRVSVKNHFTNDKRCFSKHAFCKMLFEQFVLLVSYFQNNQTSFYALVDWERNYSDGLLKTFPQREKRKQTISSIDQVHRCSAERKNCNWKNILLYMCILKYTYTYYKIHSIYTKYKAYVEIR